MKKKVSKVLSVMCSVATLATLFGINSASAMDEKELAQKLMHGGSKATGKRKRRREIHGPSPLKIETEKEIIEAIKKIGGLKKYISKVLLEKVESILKINPVKIERFKSGLKNVINELERRKKDLEEAKSGGKPVNDVNRWISEASSLEESLEGFKSDCERDLSFIMQETINDLRRDTGKLKDGISSENFANKWVFMFLKSIKLYRLREDVNVPVSVVGDVLDNTVKVEDVQLRMLVSFANHMKEVKMSLSTLGNGIDFSQLISAYIKLAELEDSSSVEDREFAEETLNPFFMGGKIPEVVNGKMVADIVNAMEAAEMAKAAKAEAKKAVEEEAKRSRVESLSSEAASADGCDSKTSSLDKEIDEAIEKIKEYEKYLKSEYSKIKQMVSGSISLLFEKVIKDEISRLQELRKKLECSKRGNESVDDVRELIRNEPSLNESLDDFKLECKRNLGNTTRKMFKSIWNVPLDRKESVSRNNIMNKLVVGFLGLCEKCNKEYSILKLDDDFFVAVVDDILNNEKDVKDADFRTFVFFAEHMMKKNAKVESEKKNDVLGKSCVCGIKFDEFVSSYIRLAKLGDGPLVGPRLEKLDDIFRKIYGRDEVIAVINEEIMEDIEEAEESLSSEAASADDSSSPDKEKIYDAIKKIDASIKQFLEPENLKKALNSLLPSDIYIKSIVEVNDDFHARFNVTGKEYIYKINMGEYDPIERNYVYQYNKRLDVVEMERALKYLEGVHNFKAFTKTNEENKDDYERKIIQATLIRNYKDVNKVTISLLGTGFLRYMVRNIVGTLIEIGEGKRKSEDIITILESQDRRQAGKTAHPEGLYLKDVFY